MSVAEYLIIGTGVFCLLSMGGIWIYGMVDLFRDK